jgi:hypothetical protein
MVAEDSLEMHSSPHIKILLNDFKLHFKCSWGQTYRQHAGATMILTKLIFSQTALGI